MRELEKSHPHIPRTWRLAKLKEAGNMSLDGPLIDEEEEELPFVRMSILLEDFPFGNQEIVLSDRDTLDLLFMAMVVAPALVHPKA